MKSKLLTTAISVAVACSPMVASAGGVDCSAGPLSPTCDLPLNTVIANGSGGTESASLTLDDGGGVPWVLAGDAGGFGIGQTLGNLPFVIITNAPKQSLMVTANGNIGVGTGSPTASVHVKKTSGSKVTVENTGNVANPSSPAVMFELRRKGAARFDIVDTNSGVAWAFQNRDGAFDISKVGTGVQEFQVDGSGNLTIQGALIQLSDVNSKHDFQALDGQTVLAEISRLPISKWRYKADATDSQHIGPTAQDFYATFNVGMNDKTIAPLDVASVAVAGVKELHTIVERQQAALAAKDAQLAEMNQRMSELEDSMNHLLLTMQHASR